MLNESTSDLTALLCALEPRLNPGVYVFTSVADGAAIDPTLIIAAIREPEGLSLVLREADAIRFAAPILFRCAWVTLTVASDLHAVGLTAAFATALSDAGISCNVVAGAYHDHIFVPIAEAERTLEVLRSLQARARAARAPGAPGAAE